MTIDGRAVQSFGDLRRVLEGLRVGDSTGVEIARAGAGRRLRVGVTGYREPRIHFGDAPEVTPAARARRARWLDGW